MDKWVETKQLQVHFVSAAGLVYKDGKVLLIRSARRGWEFPGGVVEQGVEATDVGDVDATPTGAAGPGIDKQFRGARCATTFIVARLG